MWISENEFKEWAQIDVDESITLENWILQGQDIIEKYLDRNIEQANYTEKHDGGNQFVFLKNYPVSSITSVKEDDIILDSSEYGFTETGILYLKDRNFSEGIQNIEVSYTAGYSEIPDSLKRALTIVVQNLIAYAVRPTDLPTSQGMEGMSVNYSKDEILTDAVKKILNPFKRVNIR